MRLRKVVAASAAIPTGVVAGVIVIDDLADRSGLSPAITFDPKVGRHKQRTLNDRLGDWPKVRCAAQRWWDQLPFVREFNLARALVSMP